MDDEHRYCRDCGYPLAQLGTPQCPECGRAFDPADPRTWRRTRRPGMARVLRWGGAAVLLLAVLIGAFVGYCQYRIQRIDRGDAIVARLGGWSSKSTEAPDWLVALAGKKPWQRFDAYVLANTPATDGDVLALPDIDRLRTLWLADTQVTHACLAALSGGAVERLSLSKTAVRNAQPINALQHLTELYLDGTPVEELVLSGKPDLQRIDVHRSSLRRLRLRDMPSLHMLDAFGSALEEVVLEDCPRLKVLNLQNLPVARLDLTRVPQLERLYLAGTRIDAGPLTAASLSNAIHLELTGTAVDDTAMPVLAGLPRLGQLDVAGSRITGVGLAALRNSGVRGIEIDLDQLEQMRPFLAELTSIRSVTVADDRAQGWSRLAALERLPELESLLVRSASFYDDGLAFLPDLPLQSLLLECPLMDDAIVALLAMEQVQSIHVRSSALSAGGGRMLVDASGGRITVER